MSIAIVLTGPQDVRLVHWAARLAKGRERGLVLFWTRHRRGEKRIVYQCSKSELPEELRSICETLAADGFTPIGDSQVPEDDDIEAPSTLLIEVVTIASSQLPQDLEKEIDQRTISSVIVPSDAQLKSGTPESAIHDHLLKHIPCEIVFLTPGAHADSEQCRQIISPVGEGPHSASCLQMANDISSVSDSKLVALHIEPEFDVTTFQVAQKILKRAVDRALGKNQDGVLKRVILDDDVVDGIHQIVDDSTDLIILGMRRGITKRFSSRGIAAKLVNSQPGPSIAVLQSAIPLSSQLGRWLNAQLQDIVPQLARDHRVHLVERIQSSSRWDFDFVLLICLSTLIAAGGLIQNSAAVVIGAMLVAPLMTPLLGNGLSITQGNLLLFKGSLATVLRGFLLAFMVSWIVGLVASNGVTSEMTARGSPTVLDILVAMVGGVAAAYASGRPNLLSALPGVAIAASLVPPIATSGIATSLGDFGLALRAAMLFFTNIVAIVLGTWLAFLAVGIRSSHEHSELNRWTFGAAATLLLLIVSLGVYDARLGRANTQNLLMSRLNQLAETDNWYCTNVEVRRVKGEKKLTVHLHSPKGMPPERLGKIREAVRDAFDHPPVVEFVTTTE